MANVAAIRLINVVNVIIPISFLMKHIENTN